MFFKHLNFKGEKTFVSSFLLLENEAHSKWDQLLKEKNCSLGSKFFPLKVDLL